jgi:hypothetical protein
LVISTCGRSLGKDTFGGNDTCTNIAPQQSLCNNILQPSTSLSSMPGLAIPARGIILTSPPGLRNAVSLSWNMMEKFCAQTERQDNIPWVQAISTSPAVKA